MGGKNFPSVSPNCSCYQRSAPCAGFHWWQWKVFTGPSQNLNKKPIWVRTNMASKRDCWVYTRVSHLWHYWQIIFDVRGCPVRCEIFSSLSPLDACSIPLLQVWQWEVCPGEQNHAWLKTTVFNATLISALYFVEFSLTYVKGLVYWLGVGREQKAPILQCLNRISVCRPAGPPAWGDGGERPSSKFSKPVGILQFWANDSFYLDFENCSENLG